MSGWVLGVEDMADGMWTARFVGHIGLCLSERLD